MAFLNLRKRFLPAKRVWKVFTTQFHRKLHKLQRSKAIKKPNNNPHKKTTSKTIFWNSLSLQPRLRLRLQHKRWTAKSTTSHRSRLQKRPAPLLLINEFLTETQPISLLKELHQPSTSASASMGPTEKSPPSAYHKTKLSESNLPGKTSKGNTGHMADDIWESLVMASPQMQRINERAEDFITRFRADMQLQEMLAGRL